MLFIRLSTCVLSIYLLLNTLHVLADSAEHDDVLVVNDALNLHAVIEKSLPHYPNLLFLNAKARELTANEA